MNASAFLEPAPQDGRGAGSELSEDHSCPGNGLSGADPNPRRAKSHAVKPPLHLNIQKSKNIREARSAAPNESLA